ncbi:MAG: hypothetical protein LBU88_02045 [Treponema sp.]|jgi:hypothetical protein|nr:hypothetical protein [Treponema sp.]
MKSSKLYRMESRSAKIIVALVMLFAFLFMGCPPPDDEDYYPSLDGTWKESYGDAYIINLSAETLEYDDGSEGMFESSYKGDIKEIIFFNNNRTAGIIFIKYTNKPKDFSTEEPPEGDYIGVYFRNLTGTQGDFSTPSDYPADPIPATNTMQEAKVKFTEDTAGTYAAYWPTYIKQ